MSHSLFGVAVKPETSVSFQRFLFKNGFGWGGERKEIEHEDMPYLFPWSDDHICYGSGIERDDVIISLPDAIAAILRYRSTP